MSRHVRAVGGMLIVLALMLAFASADSFRSEDAGARPPSDPRVGEVVFSDTVSRPTDDCGARRQVRAFQNRLRPRREKTSTEPGSLKSGASRSYGDDRPGPARRCP